MQKLLHVAVNFIVQLEQATLLLNKVNESAAIFAKACFGHPSPSKRQKLRGSQCLRRPQPAFSLRKKRFVKTHALSLLRTKNLRYAMLRFQDFQRMSQDRRFAIALALIKKANNQEIPEFDQLALNQALVNLDGNPVAIYERLPPL
jgi:hypothetical protein